MTNPPVVRRIASITPAENVIRSANREMLDPMLIEACKECPKPVWFTAFFDGTGNNFTADGGGLKDPIQTKYSNIAKLAQFAMPKDTQRAVMSYVEGVGTPCEKVGDTGKGLDGALGMAAAAKGEDRIRWMLGQLEQHVARNMKAVSQINVAVFGFSRGATEARAFVRMLTESLAENIGGRLWWRQTNMKGLRPEVVVYFLGILDTVSSTGFGGSRLESVVEVGSFVVLGPAGGGALYAIDKGGHAAWANDLRIPDYVRRCVHYVASHEVREKFPSDSVREDQKLPSNCTEVFYPGMHSDVGGGYEHVSQEGRSNQLANVPLNNMFIEAWKAGVPLKPPAEVMASAGDLFEISAELEDLWNVYMGEGVKGVGAAPSADRLEGQVVWHMNRYYQWRASRSRRLADGRLKPPGGVDAHMAITDREWNEDVDMLRRAAGGFLTRTITDQEHAIDDAVKVTGNWLGSIDPALRAKFDRFFDLYVHDSIAGFKKQMEDGHVGFAEDSRWSVNRRYFVGKRGSKFLYWCYAGNKAEQAAAQIAMLEQKPSTDPSDPTGQPGTQLASNAPVSSDGAAAAETSAA